MFKNVGLQKVTVYAKDYTTGAPKTGDAGNLTCYVSKDDGMLTALGDTSATEISAMNARGLYTFDLTKDETNGDKLIFTAKSSTANVVIEPQVIYALPAGFADNVMNANVIMWGGEVVDEDAIPTAAAGSAGGLPTVDNNNRVQGVHGSISGDVDGIVKGGGVSTFTGPGVVLGSTGLDEIDIDGYTLPEATRIMAAMLAGILSGAGSGTEVFKGLNGTTVRVTVTADSAGNRSDVEYTT